MDERTKNGTTLSISADPRARYRQCRIATESLCAPLSPEDCQIQSMTEVSPTKWHLAHTTWFFETFVLRKFSTEYREVHPEFNYVFNSYYEAFGDRLRRDQRGLISRPSLEEVFDYRRRVDQGILDLFEHVDDPECLSLVEIGVHHEEQHQELLLTDIKHVFSQNPLEPAYAPIAPSAGRDPGTLRWKEIPEGVRAIGHDGNDFAYDNETPRHRVFLESFRIAERPVSNGEYLNFMRDGGYDRPELWLSDGWAIVKSLGWRAPSYWRHDDAGWRSLTLGGPRPIVAEEPVCHVSFYEADAYARWAGARLPTESEWEAVAERETVEGNFQESGLLHPRPFAGDGSDGTRFFGDVWEWTASPYVAYPGYRSPQGALGEYNGKFMCNQMVLRGGSCLTPRSHIRTTYRNFYPPEARWQVTGIRLAKDL